MRGGEGYTFFCKKCNKEYMISLGTGMLSYQCNFKNILYACPACGKWEVKSVDLIYCPFPDMRKDIKKIHKKHANKYCKKIIDSVEMEDHNKPCSNCGNIMNVYEVIRIENNSSVLKLVCKDCNSELKFAGFYCWD